ncbi:MAG: hypothetical protein JWM87_4405 [Candidatus Eremiobacteraeota bacterium]|nr:hypothetical protein [Candidatus Eremiobacteraeota bacterium]
MISLIDSAQGLYGDPDWTNGDAGMFAIVIGISEYSFLDGGQTPAAQTYGFGQLATSAQTAYRVFRWLREAYDYRSAPLVRARLLLAPTLAEIAIIDGETDDPKAATSIVEVSARPTLAACQKAIRAWRTEMATLSVENGAQSRAFFFFSGHGIQVTDHPLLLPSDWLSDDAPTPSSSISIDNLVNGLASVSVTQQWFFCDACRSSNDHLNRLQNVDGAPILEEQLGASFERSYPIVSSAGRGLEAFEPATPDRGCTLFGSSLLDGLYVKSPALIRCKPPPCRLEFDPLLNFVRKETARKLTAAQVGSRRFGTVLTGQYGLDNPTVTHVPERSHVSTVSAGGALIVPSEFSTDSGDLVESKARAKTVSRRPRAPRETVSHDPNEDPQQRFGSIALGAFFSRGHAGLAPIVYDVVRRANNLRHVEATFETVSNGPVQLTWTHADGTGISALVPECARQFRVSVDTDNSGDVIAIDVDVEGDGRAETMHQIYRRYRKLDPFAAARRLNRDINTLRRFFMDKEANPVAALEAALILQRTGRYGALYGDFTARRALRTDDWLANLAEWFPEMGSDACILLAQRLVDDPSGDIPDLDRIAGLVAQIPRRGLPYTDEAMNYLVGLARLAEITPDRVAPRVRAILPELPRLSALIRESSVLELLLETRGLYAIYSAESASNNWKRFIRNRRAT